MNVSLVQRATAIEQDLVEVRRWMHRHPELSGEEYETTRKLRTEAEQAGLRILDLGLETGVVAVLEGAEAGPTVALRADIDALPVEEKTGAAYTSAVSGVMHACGHDFHSAALVGAARLLAGLDDKPKGNVLFLWQPAEEAVGGASTLLEAGAFDQYRPTAVFGLHNRPDLRYGTVGVKAGPLMAAVDTFGLVVRGKGGHAAVPQATIDPIVAGAAIVGALQTVVSRSVDPVDAAVVSVGSFHGGTRANIIPDSVRLEGTVRTFRDPVRKLVEERIRSITAQVAHGYGCEIELEYRHHVPAVDNDSDAAELVREAVRQVLGAEALVDAPVTTASEDFSLYQREVPGCFFWMGVGNKDRGIDKGWHHPEFDVEESALPLTAAVLAAIACQALEGAGS